METLTRRENQIAELIALGWAKKEVAEKLNISSHTVHTTTRNIFDKLQIQKATELSVWYFITRYKLVLKEGAKASIVITIVMLIMITEFSFLRPRTPNCRRTEIRLRRRQENDNTLFQA